MKHKFTVFGSIIPYTRVTTKSKFVSKQWQRYAEYKNKIVASFLNSVSDENLKREYLQNFRRYGKVLNTGNQKIYVSSTAYFANKKHGDPDNCQKCVQDSLFVSDKYISGVFDFYYDTEHPRLEIMIFTDIEEWRLVLRNI